MKFKTAQGVGYAARQFDRALALAAFMKKNVTAFRDRAVAGSVRVNDLDVGLVSSLVETRDELQRAAATPGIARYAKTQFDDTYDMGAAFTSMMGELDTTIAFLIANLPKDANGVLLGKTFLPDGRTTGVVIIDAAALSAIVNRLDTLLDTID